jgi:hypothetical protein
VQQRLASGDDDDGRPALVDGFKALGNTQALIEARIGLVDLAACGAGQIAAEQRLEHQNQRIAPHTAQMAAENVRADPDFLLQGNSHGGSL